MLQYTMGKFLPHLCALMRVMRGALFWVLARVLRQFVPFYSDMLCECFDVGLVGMKRKLFVYVDSMRQKSCTA